MKKSKLLIAFLLFVGLPSLVLQAQNAVVVGGGDGAGTGGSISYSVGQVAFTTNTGTTGSVAQGVQQAYTVEVVGIDQNKWINLACSVYPNPTTDVLWLTIDGYTNQKLNCQLYDMNGKVYLEQAIDQEKTSISLQAFRSAVYFLRVVDNNTVLKVFKIVKN